MQSVSGLWWAAPQAQDPKAASLLPKPGPPQAVDRRRLPRLWMPPGLPASQHCGHLTCARHACQGKSFLVWHTHSSRGQELEPEEEEPDPQLEQKAPHLVYPPDFTGED